MKKNLFIIFAVLMLLLGGCSNSGEKTVKTREEVKEMVEEFYKDLSNENPITMKSYFNDELLTEVIAREIKTRNESIKEFEKGGRNDLVEQTQNEIEVLKKYLPEQLSEEEVDNIIEEVFNEVKPESMRDMGKVMGLVTPKVKGRFDMSEVSAKIKSKLS